MVTDIKSKALRKGLREIKVGDNKEFREKLMQTIGCTTRVTLLKYIKGKARLDVVTAQNIEQLFKEYGVVNPWGE